MEATTAEIAWIGARALMAAAFITVLGTSLGTWLTSRAVAKTANKNAAQQRCEEFLRVVDYYSIALQRPSAFTPWVRVRLSRQCDNELFRIGASVALIGTRDIRQASSEMSAIVRSLMPAHSLLKLRDRERIAREYASSREKFIAATQRAFGSSFRESQ